MTGIPETFGRTPRDAARAAVILALLGCGAVAAVERLLTRPHTPLGEAIAATGIPGFIPLALGVGAVLALSLIGYFKSVRAAEVYRLTEGGFQVRGSLGEYTLAWDNISDAAVTPGQALGFRVRSRERVLETHRGSDQQREWLATMEPFGEWDFLYPRADLGRPPEQVLEWVRSGREGAGTERV